jgi:hypothetical protein
MTAFVSHKERFGDMDGAIERYFQVEAEIIADMKRRHAEHTARLQSLNAEWETE